MIIKTLLDLDFYKLTMGQLAFERFPKVKVRYAFNNRTTNIKLADHINKDQLIQEIESIRELKLTDEEGEYLKTLNIFSDKYIDYLKSINLPEVNITENDDGQFEIETQGYWKDAIYWETIILSVINEYYYKSKYQDQGKLIEYGTQKNLEKYSFLSKHPEIGFVDFGTRRRFSSDWHKDVVDIMKSLPGFVGTSNVKLAKELGLKPNGTNAHEMYMIASGIWRDDLRGSQKKILDEWYDMYGEELSIALTDTFGTKAFFEDFTKENLQNWKGVRHDSGDPFEFGEKVIKIYEDNDINPKDKMIVFSDGLNLEKIQDLYERFGDRIQIGFGWGTHLTNDMGVETLSIVMKAVEVISIDGEEVINNFLVKLSDNLNKTMGPDKEVELYKSEFGYDNTDSEECVV
jgi:nicotinate phosphoribosyltransferase